MFGGTWPDAANNLGDVRRRAARGEGRTPPAASVVLGDARDAERLRGTGPEVSLRACYKRAWPPTSTHCPLVGRDVGTWPGAADQHGTFPGGEIGDVIDIEACRVSYAVSEERADVLETVWFGSSTLIE